MCFHCYICYFLQCLIDCFSKNELSSWTLSAIQCWAETLWSVFGRKDTDKLLRHGSSFVSSRQKQHSLPEKFCSYRYGFNSLSIYKNFSTILLNPEFNNFIWYKPSYLNLLRLAMQYCFYRATALEWQAINQALNCRFIMW